MTHAMELIANSDLTVQEIATELGFKYNTLDIYLYVYCLFLSVSVDHIMLYSHGLGCWCDHFVKSAAVGVVSGCGFKIGDSGRPPLVEQGHPQFAKVFGEHACKRNGQVLVVGPDGEANFRIRIRASDAVGAEGFAFVEDLEFAPVEYPFEHG